jgi:AcrR family transcriptional regulator
VVAVRRLSRPTVLDAAEELVDRDGWRALTMTGLAKVLGVRGPTLYGHVDGLEALLGEVQVRAHAELARRLQRAAMGKTGRGAFRSLADVLRSFADDHPGLYDLAMSEAIDLPAVLVASEPSGVALIAVIESFGVPAPDRELLMNCLATLHGVIALERAGFFGDAVDVGTVYDRAVDMVVLLLEQGAQS